MSLTALKKSPLATRTPMVPRHRMAIHWVVFEGRRGWPVETHQMKETIIMGMIPVRRMMLAGTSFMTLELMKTSCIA